MQGLYPIIRRIRRPLLPEDAPSVVVGSVEHVRAEAKAIASRGRDPETGADTLDSTVASANPTPARRSKE